MLPESEELLKRIRQIVQAESREVLLEEIDQFLEDVGLNEEAERSYALKQLADQASPILRHLTLIFAFRTYDPSNSRDVNHWKDELNNFCDKMLDKRMSITFSIEDEHVYNALKTRINQQHIISGVRRQFIRKGYPPFVLTVFDSLYDSSSTFNQYVYRILDKLSKCKTGEEIEKIATKDVEELV